MWKNDKIRAFCLHFSISKAFCACGGVVAEAATFHALSIA